MQTGWSDGYGRPTGEEKRRQVDPDRKAVGMSCRDNLRDHPPCKQDLPQEARKKEVLSHESTRCGQVRAKRA